MGGIYLVEEDIYEENGQFVIKKEINGKMITFGIFSSLDEAIEENPLSHRPTNIRSKLAYSEIMKLHPSFSEKIVAQNTVAVSFINSSTLPLRMPLTIDFLGWLIGSPNSQKYPNVRFNHLKITKGSPRGLLAASA